MATHHIAFHCAILVAMALLSSSTDAFLPPSATKVGGKSTTTLSAFPPEFLDGILGSPDSDGLSPLVEEARGKFWFYFLAGSGAGGIGAAQLPAVFRDASEARALSAAKRTGSSSSSSSSSSSTRKGGDTTATLDAGPFVRLYYDSEISAYDLSEAIGKAPAADYISGRSTSKNFMASRGYIERSDFVKEMDAKKCDPLASYVLFDAISSGKGGVVSPIVYDDKLRAYRDGSSAPGVVASSFAGDLNGFLAVKLGAFFGLVICLLVDFGLVAKNGIQGFLL